MLSICSHASILPTIVLPWNLHRRRRGTLRIAMDLPVVRVAGVAALGPEGSAG